MLRFETAGESHGECLVATLNGLPAGIPISLEAVNRELWRRQQGFGRGGRMKIETDRVEVIKGEPVRASLEREGSGDTSAWRCGNCHTLLYADHPMLGDAIRFVRVGTLDEGERLAPEGHFFVRSKHPWVVIPEGVPAFETLPEKGMGLGADAKARLQAAMRSK